MDASFFSLELELIWSVGHPVVINFDTSQYILKFFDKKFCTVLLNIIFQSSLLKITFNKTHTSNLMCF